MVINKTKFTPMQHQGLHTTTSHGPLIHHVVPHNGSRIDVLSQPRGSFHMDKMNNFFFQILICFINLKSLFFVIFYVIFI
jgi:hypothetical protein